MTLSLENELISLKASLETADEVVEKTLIAYDKNEYLALVFAAVNVSRGSERSIEEHVSKVAKDTGLSKKEIKNIRTRFLRKGRVSTEYRDLAFRFSNAPKDYDKDQ